MEPAGTRTRRSSVAWRHDARCAAKHLSSAILGYTRVVRRERRRDDELTARRVRQLRRVHAAADPGPLLALPSVLAALWPGARPVGHGARPGVCGLRVVHGGPGAGALSVLCAATPVAPHAVERLRLGSDNLSLSEGWHGTVRADERAGESAGAPRLGGLPGGSAVRHWAPPAVLCGPERLGTPLVPEGLSEGTDNRPGAPPGRARRPSARLSRAGEERQHQARLCRRLARLRALVWGAWASPAADRARDRRPYALS